ncbi:hypothetical protein GGI07_005118 [Coemansia sp. Benny D115]|nr:hypothetical protein GGI07_005118 [Coemansia sp. Benny D115]
MQTGQCPEDDCGKRHSTEPTARTTKPPSEVPCRNEENGGQCTRPGCIFKHANSNPPAKAPNPSGLNPGAKVFVPKVRARPTLARPPGQAAGGFSNMEWTPNDKEIRPALQGQARPLYANREWVPNAASGQVTAAVRPQQQQLFGNKEWTPAAAATNTADKPMQPSGKPALRPPRPTMAANLGANVFGKGGGAFGNTSSAFGNVGGAFANASAKSSAFGNSSGKSSAFSVGRPLNAASAFSNKSALMNTSLDDMQGDDDDDNGMDVEITPASQAPMQEFGALGPSAESKASSRAESVAESMSDSKPVEKCSKTTATDPVGSDRSMSNSPVSMVCYASQFPTYMKALEPTEDPHNAKPVEVKDEQVKKTQCNDKPSPEAPSPVSKAAELAAPIKVIDTTTGTTAENPAIPTMAKTAVVKAALSNDLDSRPRASSTTTSVDGGDSLPKMLSFQEIIERKRRKQAEEAARLSTGSPVQPTAVSVVRSAPVTPTPQVMDKGKVFGGLVGKRRIRVIDDDDDDDMSDASERKRAKSTVVSKQASGEVSEHEGSNKSNGTTDFVAMFEKELADMSMELSGPLQNTPISDRISRAVLNQSYVDTDISQLLSDP